MVYTYLDGAPCIPYTRYTVYRGGFPAWFLHVPFFDVLSLFGLAVRHVHGHAVRPEVVLMRVRGRRLPGRRIVARRQQVGVLLLLAHTRFGRDASVRLRYFDLVPVRIGPVLDLEHEQYDQHDDDERGRGHQHHERRALGRFSIDRRVRDFRWRRFRRRHEDLAAKRGGGHHRFTVPFVVTAAVTVVPATVHVTTAAVVRFRVRLSVATARVHRRRLRRSAGDLFAVRRFVVTAADGGRRVARSSHRSSGNRRDRRPRVRHGLRSGRRR